MISFCLTNFNRFESTIKSFEKIIGHPLISEYIILDDCSTDGSYHKLKQYFLGSDVQVLQQPFNKGMSKNKYEAIATSNAQHCIIFDSDNIIDRSYIRAIPLPMSTDTIYAPCFARPHYDYRKYSGMVLSKENIKIHMNDISMHCLLNTANYVVPRNEYCAIYQYNPEVKGADTIWFNYLWLRAGNKIKIVEKMEYDHLYHDGSEFIKDLSYNLAHVFKINEMIKAI